MYEHDISLQISHFTMLFWPVLQGKQLGDLLDEDPTLMEKRLQMAKRLELYKKARDEVDSVSWARWIWQDDFVC